MTTSGLSLVFVVAAVLAVLAGIPIAARWLRVAQREYYLPSWVSRCAALWISRSPATAVLAALSLLLTAASLLGLPGPLGGLLGWAAVPAIVLLAFLPIGLGVRGTSAKFAFTPRMRRLIAIWVVLMVVVTGGLGLLLGPGGFALALLLAAPLTDLALLIALPIENALSRKYLVEARRRLAQVRPRIIAITGSYGKTSTKGYVAHLLASAFSVVASPASFNNLMGLSRAVNERLAPGTEFFIAEMGAYGPGEIRELAEPFPPDIAAITTIGEAHLQRMRTRETILRAKSEIVERASSVVLPIDEPGLAALAERCRADGKRVVTVSARGAEDVDVSVAADGTSITIRENGERRTAAVELPAAGHAVNLAVAAGIALAAGADAAVVLSRLAGLPTAHHRAEIQQAPEGALVIDDTYNSNPVGAATAVDTAAALAAEHGGPLIVVSPGMVELGPVQAERNREFGARVTAVGGTLYAVGRTNRAALVAGAGPTARVFASRREAAAAAVKAAGSDGVMLYENDLPDHYP